MTSEDPREGLRRALRDRVGGFFRNTRHEPGVTCRVCSGPATEDLCSRCDSHRAEYGARLADHVLTLTYARGNAPGYHQSAYTVRAYKGRPPSEKSAVDMALVVIAATWLHHDCVARVAGRPWSAVTFIPSASRPGIDHPVAELARNVWGLDAGVRFLLEVGPSIEAAGRAVLPDRFVVPASSRDRVAGQHALIVDDTWTSGSKAQSAALAVRAAGAQIVTVLCVSRWCRHDWPDHRALLDASSKPYDAAICPLTRATCPQ